MVKITLKIYDGRPHIEHLLLKTLIQRRRHFFHKIVTAAYVHIVADSYDFA